MAVNQQESTPRHTSVRALLMDVISALPDDVGAVDAIREISQALELKLALEDVRDPSNVVTNDEAKARMSNWLKQ